MWNVVGVYDNEDVDHSLCFFCGKVGLDDRVHLVHVGASPHDPHADGGDKYRDEMCFWLGSAYDTADPPNPLEDDLFIQNRESMEFFVW